METSAPSTENVEPPLATGLAAGRGSALGRLGSGFFENMRSGLQEGTWIDSAVVDADLEMKVRAGRPAGAADQSDDVSGVDRLSDIRLPGGHVRIARQHAIAMSDLDHLAVTGLSPNETHLAVGRRMNGGAFGATKVEARMHRCAAVEGVAPIAEAGRDHPNVGGHHLRNAAQAAFERIHAREAERKPFKAGIEATVGRGGQLFER